MSDTIQQRLERMASTMENISGNRPLIATLAPDAYNDLCAEIVASRQFNQIPLDRRIPFRVGTLLISEDEDAAPGHAYFVEGS